MILLDVPWPKVRRGKQLLAEVLGNCANADGLLATLDDRSAAPDEELPATGVTLEWERKLSSDAHRRRWLRDALIDSIADHAAGESPSSSAPSTRRPRNRVVRERFLLEQSALHGDVRDARFHEL